MAAINEFFRTSQLSTILDQTNPLSEIDNLNRLTVMGTGGISRERAAFSIRDINSSQYSRICPIRSPEGPNIGLVTYMALYPELINSAFWKLHIEKCVMKNVVKKLISKAQMKLFIFRPMTNKNIMLPHDASFRRQTAKSAMKEFRPDIMANLLKPKKEISNMLICSTPGCRKRRIVNSFCQP